MGGAGSRLHGSERQRHPASQGAANLLPGAPQDHGADRRQGTCTTGISRRPCCPTTSKSTASTGTSSTTRAGISRSRTPTGASAAGRSRSAIICTRRKSRTSSPPTFAGANVDVIGPSGNISAVLFCEKEGFNPLFRAVNLANRYDLMIVSTKGVSVTAARRLIDNICGDYDLPLFVLHDFDVAGFLILGTLQRDTRRFQFSNAIEVVDLGLRLDDIEGLEREPAAATKISASILRAQLAENGASDAEIDILLNERVELNAMTSDALVAMIERKLEAYGLEKVVPDDDLLAETYRAFHRSQRLRERFEEMEQQFDKEADAADIPDDLKQRVRAILAEHADLRWDDAIQLVLDETQLSRVRAEKEKAKKKSGDFTSGSDGEDDDLDGDGDDDKT